MKTKTEKKSAKILRLEIITYLKESKNYILFTFVLFLYLLIAGLILPTPAVLEEIIKNLLREIIEKTSGLTTFELILFIFKNNAFISILGIILGAFLGIVPLILTISNGYVLGYVIKLVLKNSSLCHLWRLFPHGIFELPAVIISLGLGLKLGASLFTANPEKEFLRRFLLSIKILLFLIIPLLLIAAMIEGILIKILA